MLGFWKKKDKEEKQPEAETTEEAVVEEKKGFFKKLSEGLGKSSSKISTGISDIFTKNKLDDKTLEQLEDLLIMSDLGPVTAAKLCAAISKERFEKDISSDEIKEALAGEIEKILEPVAIPLNVETAKPFVILMVGVNGTGKTTTIGKLAKQYKDEGKKIMLAAGDTFRAAAVEQLKVWSDRVDCPIVIKEQGSDAAALAFEAIDKAIEQDIDILMIDTAGRLQNKSELMEELEKIYRVINKKLPDAPHATLAVLDATVGQNAHSQVELFAKSVNITGLIVTKLDGTAKGGVLISLAEKFNLPIHAIGIGEQVSDLRPFTAKGYSRILMGLEEID